MAIAIALPGFNELGRSVKPLLFFSETDLIYNKTHICVNLGFLSGISSCERQNFDMMKSQLSFVDCFTASRRFGQKVTEILLES